MIQNMLDMYLYVQIIHSVRSDTTFIHLSLSKVNRKFHLKRTTIRKSFPQHKCAQIIRVRLVACPRYEFTNLRQCHAKILSHKF